MSAERMNHNKKNINYIIEMKWYWKARTKKYNERKTTKENQKTSVSKQIIK